MNKDMTIEDLLFIIGPQEQVSILYPVEDEVMDEPFDGSCMVHNVYGPCMIFENRAIDMYVSLPKSLKGVQVANVESIVTKDKDNHVTSAIRIILKEADRITYREAE